MLVLGRREGESIQIGDAITVTIVGSNGPVKVGIKAPDGVPILRAELSRRDAFKAAQRTAFMSLGQEERRQLRANLHLTERCQACDGWGVDEKGEACEPCNASGVGS